MQTNIYTYKHATHTSIRSFNCIRDTVKYDINIELQSISDLLNLESSRCTPETNEKKKNELNHV